MKRFISVVLVVVMVLTLITACGSSNNNTKAPETTSAGNTQKEATTSGDTKKVHKLKVLGPVDENREVKFSERENYPVWQILDGKFKEKGLEITYETVPSDQYEVVIQTRLASADDLPDFVNLSIIGSTQSLALAEQGLLLPINKILEKSDGTAKKFLDEVIPFVYSLNTAPDGNMYWISNVQKITYQGKPGSTCMVIMIRKDWLDKLNIPAPTTADEFLDVMKQFRDRDANGDSVPNEILAINPVNFNNGIAQWFGLGTDISAVSIEDKKVVSPWYQPGIKEYFKYLNKLVKEGIADTSLFGASSGERQNQKLAENQIGAMFSYAMQAWLEPAIKAENPQFQPIGPLPAVDGITPVNSIENPSLCWGNWAFTKNCKDEEGAAKLLDILISEEYQTLTTWGIEGQTFEVIDGINTYKEGIGNKYYKEMRDNRNTAGQWLYGDSIFPRIRFAPMETEINSNPPHKAEFQKKVAFYSPTFPYDNSSFLAMPEEEKLDELNSIMPDLTTYSHELAIQLAIGEKSLDDWDKYMEDFKRLKLDRVIEINQERLDTFFSRQ